MQMCQAHWDDLRQKINDLGLSSLVAQNGKEAADSAQRQLDGVDTKSDFDPLMGANWAIMSNALTHGGLYLMSLDPNGEEYCPLCELNLAFPTEENPAAEWIDKATQEQLVKARELALAPKVQ